MTSQEPNPYESPQTIDKIPDEKSSEWKNILVRWFPRIFNLQGRMLMVWWTIIFASNLIIPSLIASDVALGDSQLGVFFACVLLFLFGVFLCVNLRPHGRAMVLGGAVVAVT